MTVKVTTPFDFCADGINAVSFEKGASLDDDTPAAVHALKHKFGIKSRSKIRADLSDDESDKKDAGAAPENKANKGAAENK